MISVTVLGPGSLSRAAIARVTFPKAKFRRESSADCLLERLIPWLVIDNSRQASGKGSEVERGKHNANVFDRKHRSGKGVEKSAVRSGCQYFSLIHADRVPLKFQCLVNEGRWVLMRSFEEEDRAFAVARRKKCKAQGLGCNSAFINTIQIGEHLHVPLKYQTCLRLFFLLLFFYNLLFFKSCVCSGGA